MSLKKDFQEFYTANSVADILGVSKRSIKSRRDDLFTLKHKKNLIHISELSHYPIFEKMMRSNWDRELKTKPRKKYNLIELFAGAGGLALGFKKAGLHSLLLNDFDKDCCKTLKTNTNTKVVHDSVENIDFTEYEGKVDLLSGGFPCQAFSYAGKKLGFKDTRGTLFYEFARAVKETSPKVIVGENVRGLLSHEKGKTVEVMKNVIDELGYDLVEPTVLKAIFYQVPQKRERLFLIGIRKDLNVKDKFKFPDPYFRIMTVRDALKKGELYSSNVPKSLGSEYPDHKKRILKLVPQGGYWRDLPDDLQREYMGGSYFLGGGKTGMARRLSWGEPSLTLTCAPAQKQTERCHPSQTRPLTIREYARIQTFPDDWEFEGSISSQYKQIGNAVPVNMAHALGRSLVRLLNYIG
jgi:DNA (cytosine-5)-methyltransferase 1